MLSGIRHRWGWCTHSGTRPPMVSVRQLGQFAGSDERSHFVPWDNKHSFVATNQSASFFAVAAATTTATDGYNNSRRVRHGSVKSEVLSERQRSVLSDVLSDDLILHEPRHVARLLLALDVRT
ncbi:hypothetical protein H257_18112 [Aphanomyces astaci]|uniref:Uncharacterized protein n=1 Tax=Aphanomyces astaci TaxID=112090 RepID=W4FC88_APHAT|nr:hypothetical protein H257_18112 [Aphanomyces astaci]ETV65092.1 hypothetical protein H257_18112 [Aphanomyces astaci]|eukprot:XP_009845423.1 hypothetical protein H257_18112 [Aphanomyces astaci]